MSEPYHVYLCPRSIVTGPRWCKDAEAQVRICFLLHLFSTKFHVLVSYWELTAGTVKPVPWHFEALEVFKSPERRKATLYTLEPKTLDKIVLCPENAMLDESQCVTKSTTSWTTEKTMSLDCGTLISPATSAKCYSVLTRWEVPNAQWVHR